MRATGFYILLILPLTVGIVIIGSNFFEDYTYIAEDLLRTILRISPTVSKDLSLFGEITPFVLAAATMSLKPSSDGAGGYIPIILVALTYGMYLYLSVYFFYGVGEGLLATVSSPPEVAREKLLTIITAVRTMTIAIAGALVGLKVNAI